MISARGTPGRVVRNDFLDDLTIGRHADCSERFGIQTIIFASLWRRIVFVPRVDLSLENRKFSYVDL